ncbi:MAG: phosphoribosylanthranilate isomerase [Verrucomicrobiales bacterium]|nr:phosphoribosylanthranilate isomerase [Verrucomicrobiales bacterium]
MQPSFFAPGPVKAKICGLTRGDEAAQIAAMGADALGINFWPGSKRHIAPEMAAPWLRELAGVVTRVGVFVNASDAEMLALLEEGLIDAAQLHGDEAPDQVARLISRGHVAYKALGVRDRAGLDAAAGFPGSVLLLDAWAPVTYGGTGETMDWALGREAVERWPERRIVLAGGLTPENVAEAIRQVGPFAVDVASGVESGTPGLKDLEKVRAFLEAVAKRG